jgi:hypothetical protein
MVRGVFSRFIGVIISIRSGLNSNGVLSVHLSVFRSERRKTTRSIAEVSAEAETYVCFVTVSRLHLAQFHKTKTSTFTLEGLSWRIGGKAGMLFC